MRTEIVNRYYCDHCSKGMMRKSSMLRHEPSCIKNPERSACHLCVQGGLERVPMDELRKAMNDGGVEAVSDLAQGCPACILSAIVQTREVHPPDEDGDTGWVDFDYKKALSEFYQDLTDRP